MATKSTPRKAAAPKVKRAKLDHVSGAQAGAGRVGAGRKQCWCGDTSTHSGSGRHGVASRLPKESPMVNARQIDSLMANADAPVSLTTSPYKSVSICKPNWPPGTSPLISNRSRPASWSVSARGYSERKGLTYAACARATGGDPTGEPGSHAAGRKAGSRRTTQLVRKRLDSWLASPASAGCRCSGGSRHSSGCISRSASVAF